MGIALDMIGDYNTALHDGGALAQVHRTLAAQVRSGDAFIVSDLWGVLDRLSNRLRGGLKMRRLRIFGHATPGIQCIGYWRTSPLDITTGRRQLEPGDYSRVIMVIREELFNRDILMRFTPYFDRGGYTELHGCEVARGSEGEKLLQTLAKLWNVPVKGGTVPQRTGRGLEPPIVVAWPNGHIERR